MIQEALCSLKSLESHGLKDLTICSLRTSKDSCRTIKAIPLRQSSLRLMNWGMTSNGVCLTANPAASLGRFPKIVKEFSLSDVLEENVDPKYFLSEKAMKGILRRYEESDLLEEEIEMLSDALNKDALLGDKTRIRRLTPTECERLQGFPDGWTEGVSDTSRYQCLGNAVTVNVIRVLIERMFL